MSVAKEQQHTGALDTGLVLNALTAVKNGDFLVRLPADCTGVHDKIADTFNDIAPQNERIAEELGRVSRPVGREGSGRQNDNDRVPERDSVDPSRCGMPLTFQYSS